MFVIIVKMYSPKSVVLAKIIVVIFGNKAILNIMSNAKVYIININ